MGDFALGQPVARFEDERFLKGAGCYVDDIDLPRMAHATVLRSPHAHAKIHSIDVEAARQAPGVLLVLTGKDWLAAGLGTLPVASGRARSGGRNMYRPQYPVLATDIVRWVGDYVAFVVAETRHQAADAAELIQVDYEALPAAIGLADAARAGAPLVWDDCEDNICFVQTEGDRESTDAAFAAAAKVIRQRFVINRITAAPIEPRSVVAEYDALCDQYTIHTMAQRIMMYRADLAKYVLKVPASKVRVISNDVGGSFGLKAPVYNEAALSLLAARQISRPVKWTSTRSESFLSDAHARDHLTDAELALDRDGRFLAMRVHTFANAGAYSQTLFPSYADNLGSLAGVYSTPALVATTTAVYTHTNPVRAYRGNGRTEFSYIIERMVDIAADEMGIDPCELRRRNFIPSSAMPYETGLTLKYDCGEFRECMDLALEAADFAQFDSRKGESRLRGMLRGFGIACVIERAAAKGFEAAEIRVERDGSVTLVSGALSQGQGHETIFKQIVADQFGISPATIRYIQGDTDKVTFADGTGASRSATMSGTAFHLAAKKIIEKARLIAAKALGVEPGHVAFGEGVFSSPSTNRTLAIDEVADFAFDLSRLPAGVDPGLFAVGVFTVDGENFPNGCHTCEVEVDPDTGDVKIVRYTVVDDVGTVVNPLLLKGQIVGGVAQGAGQILKEDIQFDTDGQLVTGSFMDYAMPRATDMSVVQVLSRPTFTATNPLGIKGAGEAGSVGAMPAVANAIVDALSPFGVRHIEMPASPERVWRAIHKSGVGPGLAGDALRLLKGDA
ncbi:MAG: xanthine dehydrogenase family protein molybdopterin-binding subunit [Pseudorhodoplanes sp.]|uniref:xanthine dehydrogenase family protein molybdopterin-binding subunit n=1 Tax=Pseudorhodoplanes sp. TaxID=1934341 RepID=UPI003D109D1A